MKCERCGKDHDGSFQTGRFCSIGCRNKRKHSEDTKKKISGKLKGKAPSNKGKGLHGLGIRRCGFCKKIFVGISKYCCKECGTKGRSLAGRNNKNGGYKERAGTRYGGWYHGIYCNSSWELAYILYCEYNHVKVSRNKEAFKYHFDGKDRKYYPDFIVNGEYVEIKGLTNPVDLVKWDQFPHRLKVMGKAEMKPVLELVKKVYGKDFMKLYEKTNKVMVA